MRKFGNKSTDRDRSVREWIVDSIHPMRTCNFSDLSARE